ncbi:hypothetical protein [Mycolicibacterium llatzerense]|uniref:hypothetical protein n=1 Tax=Mycolicibacterium llatzerense TaxID=280871 RepID=UPI0008DD934C|nr:hypothetical protein [Mycolicibacterium llatzerense]
MSIVRVNFLPEFHLGDDAVLLTLDGPGVGQFNAAVVLAEQQGSATLEHDGVIHEIGIEPGAADIDLSPNHVVWRLDHAKAAEIIVGLSALGDGAAAAQPGHVYVDLTSPAETLVVSRDEYVDIVYPWRAPWRGRDWA